MIQKVLYTVQSVGGPEEILKISTKLPLNLNTVWFKSRLDCTASYTQLSGWMK